MNAAHVPMVFRGVTCRYCAKPISLTSPFIKREMSIKHDEARGQELSSRVFVKRCRNCLKEAIYNLDQIIDFQLDEVTSTISSSGGASATTLSSPRPVD